MPIKAFSLELKNIDENGSFVGMASTYGEVDLGGDVVERGAFTKTLESGKSRPLLWQHSAPIGLVNLRDSPAGLQAEGQLSMGIQLAKDAYTLLKDGVVRGLSIGFATVRDEVTGGVRRLVELKLFEVSLVVIPMNPAAIITQVKSAQHQRDEIDRVARDMRAFYNNILHKL